MNLVEAYDYHFHIAFIASVFNLKCPFMCVKMKFIARIVVIMSVWTEWIGENFQTFTFQARFLAHCREIEVLE